MTATMTSEAIRDEKLKKFLEACSKQTSKDRLPKLGAGSFLLKGVISRVEEGENPTYKTSWIRTTFEIVESTNPAYPVGTQVVWQLDITNSYAAENYKAYLKAARQTQTLESDAVHKVLSGQDTIAGTMVWCDAVSKVGKNTGKSYVACTWSPTV